MITWLNCGYTTKFLIWLCIYIVFNNVGKQRWRILLDLVILGQKIHDWQNQTKGQHRLSHFSAQKALYSVSPRLKIIAKSKTGSSQGVQVQAAVAYLPHRSHRLNKAHREQPPLAVRVVPKRDILVLPKHQKHFHNLPNRLVRLIEVILKGWFLLRQKQRQHIRGQQIVQIDD